MEGKYNSRELFQSFSFVMRVDFETSPLDCLTAQSVNWSILKL